MSASVKNHSLLFWRVSASVKNQSLLFGRVSASDKNHSLLFRRVSASDKNHSLLFRRVSASDKNYSLLKSVRISQKLLTAVLTECLHQSKITHLWRVSASVKNHSLLFWRVSASVKNHSLLFLRSVRIRQKSFTSEECPHQSKITHCCSEECTH